MKPAPETPLETFILAECAEAAGLPPGVINLVPAGAEVSEHLVRHRDVDKIAFTGSTAVGQRIAGICAQRTARYTLELGGKSAAIVLGGYDVEEAAARLVPTQCMMTGQVCAALTRVIVPRENHDALVSAFVRQMESVRIGDPYDPESQMGPLAIDRQLKRVQGYVDKGISEGAKLSTGGGRYKAAERGYYFEPTVFSDVNNAMTVAREEIFGPVVSIIPCEDEADAVRISNDSIYGLNGSVFTNDIEAAYRVARNMRTGTVGHNGFKVDLNVGFGGFKQSGIGREGGKQGVLAYLESKTIKLDSAPRAL
jgi:acyl-CoA reductase-like NAD-dependent aldehyde dehydrogenase